MLNNHAPLIASIVALVLILATALLFIHMGLKEGTLLGVLITGGVQVAQRIAGIQTSGLSTPPPGGSITQESRTSVQTPASPTAPTTSLPA